MLVLRFCLFTIFMGYSLTTLASSENGEDRLRGGSIAQLGSLAAVVLLHESFHGAVAWGVGAEVLWFRPYPHMLDGDLVMGSVKHRLELKDNETVQDLFVKRAWISASGSVGTMLTSLAVAPLIPQVDTDEIASFVYHYQDWALMDWPAYVTADLFFEMIGKDKHRGDWTKVSHLTGVPLWAYLIGSYASAYLVYQHNQHFVDRAIKDYNLKNGMSSSSFAPVLAAKWKF